MTSYHINPITGAAGLCRAQYECPFGPEESHYPSQEEARGAYETFGEALATPDKTARFFFMGKQEAQDFVDGDCAHLAKVLARKTGWPLVLFARDSGEVPPEKVMWDHMAVVAPDGRILDVEGLWKPEEFIARWSKTPIFKSYPGRLYPLKHQDFDKVQEDGPWFESSPTRTANRILKVLEDLRGQPPRKASA